MGQKSGAKVKFAAPFSPIGPAFENTKGMFVCFAVLFGQHQQFGHVFGLRDRSGVFRVRGHLDQLDFETKLRRFVIRPIGGINCPDGERIDDNCVIFCYRKTCIHPAFPDTDDIGWTTAVAQNRVEPDRKTAGRDCNCLVHFYKKRIRSSRIGQWAVRAFFATKNGGKGNRCRKNGSEKRVFLHGK